MTLRVKRRTSTPVLMAYAIQPNKQSPRHMQLRVVDVNKEDLREVDHFLIVLVDDLVKPLVFPEVIQVGVFPDLVELLKA